MARPLALLALVAACSSTRLGGGPPVEAPRGDTASAVEDDATARRARRIDALMKPWANEDTPGCAIAVIQDRELIYAKGYGMADLEHAVPITPETVFEIGSVSKQFTAAAVLLAAAEGKLGLDDDVRVHVPALPKLSETPTTIRHLLHHTGGLRDYGLLLMLGGSNVEWNSPEKVDSILRLPGRP